MTRIKENNLRTRLKENNLRNRFRALEAWEKLQATAAENRTLSGASTMQITNDNVHEYEHAHFSTEASDLGLRPGEWPRTIPTSLGNGQIFVALRREVRDGDLLWVDYLQGNGCIWLRIYND